MQNWSRSAVDRMATLLLPMNYGAIARPVLQLTHDAALAILNACVGRAEQLNAPVNIAIASPGGRIIASIAMDDACFLSAETAQNKALTAASHRGDTREIPAAIVKDLAVASGGKITGMAGGMPIWIGGQCVGGIGIGGASDDADIDIAVFGITQVGGFVTREQSLPQQ